MLLGGQPITLIPTDDGGLEAEMTGDYAGLLRLLNGRDKLNNYGCVTIAFTVLIEMLKHLEARGVNHVIFNLKYGKRPAEEVVEELGEEVVPEFAVSVNCE
jgi:hypothetical protein